MWPPDGYASNDENGGADDDNDSRFPSDESSPDDNNVGHFASDESSSDDTNGKDQSVCDDNDGCFSSDESSPDDNNDGTFPVPHVTSMMTMAMKAAGKTRAS